MNIQRGEGHIGHITSHNFQRKFSAWIFLSTSQACEQKLGWVNFHPMEGQWRTYLLDFVSHFCLKSSKCYFVRHSGELKWESCESVHESVSNNQFLCRTVKATEKRGVVLWVTLSHFEYLWGTGIQICLLILGAPDISWWRAKHYWTDLGPQLDQSRPASPPKSGRYHGKTYSIDQNCLSGDCGMIIGCTSSNNQHQPASITINP